MPRPPSLPQFDTAIAEAFVRASATVTGLPGYLGVRFVEMAAGRLVASMAIRDLRKSHGREQSIVRAGPEAVLIRDQWVHAVDGDELLGDRVGNSKVLGLATENPADDLAVAQPSDEA